MHTNTYFTHDVGFAKNEKFLSSRSSRPRRSRSEREPNQRSGRRPLIAALSGQTFRGSFFVHLPIKRLGPSCTFFPTRCTSFRTGMVVFVQSPVKLLAP